MAAQKKDNMLTFQLKETDKSAKVGLVETQVPEFTVCTATIQDKTFARVAFGSLDGKGAKKRCDSFKTQLPEQWIKNGCTHFTIMADDGTVICTWRDVNIYVMSRKYGKQIYWFFEVEGLYRDITWK
jgi:hypothetical protein